MPYVPPLIDGVAASRLQLPPGAWATVLDALCDHFAAISRAQWQDRIDRGRVLDARGIAIDAHTRYRQGATIFYYREVPAERRIAETEVVLHADAHLIVVDKPHGLAVTPAGSAVADTLLARLLRRFDHAELAPLHRIDSDTAGLVMFSVQAASRARYHALFQSHTIVKAYEAIAAPLPMLEFPLTRRSRMERGEPFFRMREVDGPPNAETVIDVAERGSHHWRYTLAPVTGRKHQLRVQMAALGAAISNDPYYPELRERIPGQPAAPLQLLARSLAFVDPVSGHSCRFDTTLRLEPVD